MPHSYGASFSGVGFLGPMMAVSPITSKPKRIANVTRMKMGSMLPIVGIPSFLCFCPSCMCALQRCMHVWAALLVYFGHFFFMYRSIGEAGVSNCKEYDTAT